jgi:hypothetical protein
MLDRNQNTKTAIVEGGCTDPRLPTSEPYAVRTWPVWAALILAGAGLFAGVFAWTIMFRPPLGFEAAIVLSICGMGFGLLARLKSEKRAERLASVGAILLNTVAVVAAILRASGAL